MCDGEGIGAKVDDLRRFIDRRFAELSMEISATVQLVDYSEANLTGQLTAMKEQLAAMLALPTAGTRNSGVELEAVVQTTEAAANRIMEAAEAIGDWLLEISTDPVARERINEKVNAIFEACSFQDLTSQRIRRAIDHLRQVEVMLGSIGDTPAPAAAAPDIGPDLAQAEIDKMLAG
jgi:chemotaxis protein CheZ